MRATAYSDVVRELVELLAVDPPLRRRVEDALRDRDQQPGDPWGAMTLEGFFGFFEAWRTSLPAIDREESFLHRLLKLHRTPKGLALVRERALAGWLNRFAQARGDFLDSEDSAWMIARWSEHPEIDLADFVVPEAGFRSFNELFTRKVKPGARPIAAADDDTVLVSPADSAVQAPLDLDPETLLEVKGRSLRLDELLGGDRCAAEFRHGTAMVLFLGVQDYHRFHAPVTGTIARCAMIGGLCFGCDEYPGQFFTEHRRGFFVLDTRFGPVGMVTVGIATVSSVRHTRAIGDAVRKGDELGYFAYGGSAILLLFPKGRVVLDERAENEHVLMGTRIGSFQTPSHPPSGGTPCSR
ncbi:MAG TPA: phosphatidylserine decarboxylase [Thermoanaerobaculia bacterium]|nr:phosphatidylserine decarboxylase [Thermoanaerobaculia bacterium]